MEKGYETESEPHKQKIVNTLRKIYLLNRNVNDFIKYALKGLLRC